MATFNILPQLNVLVIGSKPEDERIAKEYQGKAVYLGPQDHHTLADTHERCFDAVAAVTSEPLNAVVLSQIYRVLVAGGTFAIRSTGNFEMGKPLMFAGFVDSSTSRNGDTTEIVCRRPPWDMNAAAPLASLKRPATSVPAVASIPAQSASQNKWVLAADELNEAGSFIDEDALLEQDDAKVEIITPSSFSKDDDCGEGGAGSQRKACKNCSCGRAEAEAKASAPVKSAPVSACGSCGLGDAFRCSTCPFLGQPPFQMVGNAVKLQIL